MRKSFVLAASAAALAFSAISTTVSAHEGLYLGPSAGYYYLDDKRSEDRSDNNSSGVLGLNLGHRFHNDWALEFMAGTDVVGDDMDIAQLNGYFWLGDEEKNRYNWRPYLLAGLSVYDIDESNIRSDFDDSWQAQGGFGLSKLFENNWEVRWDARVMHKVREGQDGTNDFSVNLGLVRYFNPAPKPLPPVIEAAPEPEPYVAPVPEVYEPETRTITVRLNVEFDFDKATVRAIYGDELEAIANAMKVHEDIDLVLEGHTDARGSDEYNQDLSDRRAKAVKAKLSELYGIDIKRITAVGYGESRPIADNGTDEGRQRNRRVIGEMSYTEVAPE